MRVRSPAVAGTFYPADPDLLVADVERCLNAAENAPDERQARVAHQTRSAKALIVPHAGYIYSGPVAGTAYAPLRLRRGEIERVVLLGPSHHVPFRGLAVPSVEAFLTPLGAVALDRSVLAGLRDFSQVCVLDVAHEFEHSLEVQLPFLQRILDTFSLVPLVVGNASPEEVAEILEKLWGGPEMLLVISSDLSHYLDYAAAQQLDRETARHIEALRYEALGEDTACGRVPVRGLLLAARRRGLSVVTLDLRNSGDTAGPRDRVVGYGSFAFR